MRHRPQLHLHGHTIAHVIITWMMATLLLASSGVHGAVVLTQVPTDIPMTGGTLITLIGSGWSPDLTSHTLEFGPQIFPTQYMSQCTASSPTIMVCSAPTGYGTQLTFKVDGGQASHTNTPPLYGSYAPPQITGVTGGTLSSVTHYLDSTCPVLR